MDKLELLENIRDMTKTDAVLNYATKSIAPDLYMDKTDLLIVALLGFILLLLQLL